MAESGPRAKKKVVEKVSFRDERERERESGGREWAAAAAAILVRLGTEHRDLEGPIGFAYVFML